MNMTLREVCGTLGVSRRAVQGYEKAGLISMSGKNERGYLLYDEDAQERIRQIKLFQQMGFTLKEIVCIIDAPDNILKDALERQAEKLKERRAAMELLIREIETIIEKL